MPSRRPSLSDDVRDSILGALADGTFVVGAQLPNESEMSERYDVSRATIREAYRSLIAAGFLQSRRGSGTFVVRSPNQRSLDSSISYMAMIRESGHEPGIRVIAHDVRPASVVEAERLQLPRDSEVLSVDRVHTADGHPVIFSRDRIPRSSLPARLSDLTGSLFTMLEKRGREPRSARARLTPITADSAVSEALGVEDRAPLLHIDEIDFDDQGRAVLYSEEWHVGDVFPLWLNRRVALNNEPY